MNLFMQSIKVVVLCLLTAPSLMFGAADRGRDRSRSREREERGYGPCVRRADTPIPAFGTQEYSRRVLPLAGYAQSFEAAIANGDLGLVRDCFPHVSREVRRDGWFSADHFVRSVQAGELAADGGSRQQILQFLSGRLDPMAGSDDEYSNMAEHRDEVQFIKNLVAATKGATTLGKCFRIFSPFLDESPHILPDILERAAVIGVRMDSVDADGRTGLHYICRGAQQDSLRILLSQSPERVQEVRSLLTTKEDRRGGTPIDNFIGGYRREEGELFSAWDEIPSGDQVKDMARYLKRENLLNALQVKLFNRQFLRKYPHRG